MAAKFNVISKSIKVWWELSNLNFWHVVSRCRLTQWPFFFFPLSWYSPTRGGRGVFSRWAYQWANVVSKDWWLPVPPSSPQHRTMRNLIFPPINSLWHTPTLPTLYYGQSAEHSVTANTTYEAINPRTVSHTWKLRMKSHTFTRRFQEVALMEPGILLMEENCLPKRATPLPLLK